jgi:hypothetical protein
VRNAIAHRPRANHADPFYFVHHSYLKTDESIS